LAFWLSIFLAFSIAFAIIESALLAGMAPFDFYSLTSSFLAAFSSFLIYFSSLVAFIAVFAKDFVYLAEASVNI